MQSNILTCAPRSAFGTHQYKSLERASRKKLMQFPQLFPQLRSVWCPVWKKSTESCFGENQEVVALHKLKQKLKSQTGASITFALLLFLVCAVVGSAVLVAGTAAAGRMSKIAEMDQRYYAVNSAARLLNDLMERDEIRYRMKEPGGTNNEDGQSGGNQSGNNDGSEEEYEWLMKQSEKWIPAPNPLPLTVFLAKYALSMPKNTNDTITFNIKPVLSLAGAKLNVTATGTITKGDTENSADLIFELADTTAPGAKDGNYRIKAYFTNVGGDSFFHWKLYDIESIRTPTSPAPSSGGTEGETP